MDKVGAWVLVLLLVCSCVSNGNNGDEYDEEKRKKPCLWEWQKLTRGYSVYRGLFPSSIAHFWSMLKDVFHHVHVRFFPPNIDFRRGDEGCDATAGEVVTDALARSVGTSKATVEDAAKSAADTVHNVVKKTTSSPHTETPKHQNEL